MVELGQECLHFGEFFEKVLQPDIANARGPFTVGVQLIFGLEITQLVLRKRSGGLEMA